jgi:hypothetical protein
VDDLSVDNNRFSRIAPRFNSSGGVYAFRAVDTGRVSVRDNSFHDIAMAAVDAGMHSAIRIEGCTNVSVQGNRIENLGPVDHVAVTDAILVQAPFESVDVTSNSVIATAGGTAGRNGLSWTALRIRARPSAAGSVLDPAIEANADSERPSRPSGGFGSFVAEIRDAEVVAFLSDVNNFSGNPDRPDQPRTNVSVSQNIFGAQRGPEPIVEITAGTLCLFVGNQCSGTSPPRNEAAVLLLAPRVVATNNMISDESRFSLLLPDEVVSFAVTGNVTTGQIITPTASGSTMQVGFNAFPSSQ